MNSSDTEPTAIGGFYISTKKNKKLHGIGLKSISRIVKRYSGNLNCNYNGIKRLFHTSILLKTTSE